MQDIEIELEPTPGVEAQPDIDIELEPLAPGPIVYVAPTLVDILPADFPLPVLTRFVPNPAVRTRVLETAAAARAVDVAAPGGLEKADAALGDVRDALAVVDVMFEEPAGIAFRLHREITGKRAEWKRDGEQAIDEVGRLVIAEADRQRAAAREEARRRQDEADQRARDIAAAEVQAAVDAGAPEPVVEQLQQAVETAIAQPVEPTEWSGGSLSRNGIKRKWKARLTGTEGGDEANPAPDAMTPKQRAGFLQLVQAVAEGRASIEALLPNYSYLDKRADADKLGLAIPGVEAFQVSGLAKKRGRS